MSVNCVKLPVSRKFTYANFDQDDDIAYVNIGLHHDTGIKFLLCENKIFRVVKNGDKPDSSFSQAEYIVKNSLKNTHSKYEYQGAIEFVDIPSAKNIKIVNIESNKLHYCSRYELMRFVTNNVDLKILFGRPVFVGKNTSHSINGEITVTLECENDDGYGKFPICEITHETLIEISDEINSSACVNSIIEIGENSVIDLVVNDEENFTGVDSLQKQHISIDELTFLLQESKKQKTKKTNYILKCDLIEKIKDYLQCNVFKIGDSFKICIDNIYFAVKIDGCNMKEEKNVAYVCKSQNFHINITNNVKKTEVLDCIYQLKPEDDVCFEINSSDLKVILKKSVVDMITEKIKNVTFMKGHQFVIYVGKNKMKLTVVEIYIKSTKNFNTSENVAYVCNEIEIPVLHVENAPNIGAYVVDTDEKYNIDSILVRPVKKEVIANFDFASLLKVTSTTDVKLENVKQYFRNVVKESCVFVGRVYEYDGLKYVVENIKFIENVNPKQKVVGIFDQFTDIKINKNIQDKSINIIDDCHQTSRNLDIEVIKSFAKRMEDEGLYGMTEHVNKFVKEVILTRTNLVDDALIDLIEPTKGVILCGPPGTGKTTLARNIGKIFGSTGSRIKQLNATEIKSKWHGESEGNIRKLFKHAIEEYELYGDDAPLHILIIDEIDAIAGARGNSVNDVSDSVVNQFLGEMDGLCQFKNCVIIGITNRLEIIDPAFLRPGRFGCHIFVDLPNCAQRKLIFESYHKKLERANIICKSENVRYDSIAFATTGLSGADIKNIYQLCATEHINKKIDGILHIITEKDILSILETLHHITI